MSHWVLLSWLWQYPLRSATWSLQTLILPNPVPQKGFIFSPPLCLTILASKLQILCYLYWKLRLTGHLKISWPEGLSETQPYLLLCLPSTSSPAWTIWIQMHWELLGFAQFTLQLVASLIYDSLQCKLFAAINNAKIAEEAEITCLLVWLFLPIAKQQELIDSL